MISQEYRMLESFQHRDIALGPYPLNVATAGQGPPLLLLHGYPQTQAIWHRIAPRLAERFTLVMPDLPGYGASAGPAPDLENVHYSKRTMAAVMVALMDHLGHERFGVAGHDRGGRVGYRLALDHAEQVERFAALDMVPTLDVWEAMDWASALEAYHWPFLAQPAPVPERLIGADPEFYITHLLERWAGDPDALAAEAVSAYVSQFHKPEVVAATCADYRAGATVDMEHDRADREADRKIGCPMLVVWGRGYSVAGDASPAEIWRRWAVDVSEAALDCGHFVAEEQPEACAAALEGFFGG